MSNVDNKNIAVSWLLVLVLIISLSFSHNKNYLDRSDNFEEDVITSSVVKIIFVVSGITFGLADIHWLLLNIVVVGDEICFM